jgi:Domain of unknown function (DUF3601)
MESGTLNPKNADLEEAARLERLGDAAVSLRQPAVAYYREAQRLLLPSGMVWTDRESYDRRMELFQQIQEKLYRLDSIGEQRGPSDSPPPIREALPSAIAELSVWNFFPGLAVRVVQAFTDYDGQNILAGEVLHFVSDSYFFYEGGHTLRFAEKTIRLADIVDEHQPIIANAGNLWFQPLDGSS